ncbi:MAG: multiprotein-bridging factor 1 family protein [Candidatus Micrarchaeia archaeon]
MECEICGKREAVCLVYLEGAKMNSCQGCSRGGKVLYFFDSDSPIPTAVQQRPRSEEEIVDDYGKIIRAARMKLGLSLEELGMKIAEKANYLEHVERQTTLPSLPLARKLEKFLKIKLVETTTSITSESAAIHGKKELTLLDMAEMDSMEKKAKK